MIIDKIFTKISNSFLDYRFDNKADKYFLYLKKIE